MRMYTGDSSARGLRPVVCTLVTMGAAPSKPAPSPALAQSVDDEKMLARLTAMSLERRARPAVEDGSVSFDIVSKWEEDASADPKIQLSRTILSHTNLQEALLSRSAIVADPHVYNTEVAFKTSPITSQKSSGRCWLFATTNVLRYNIMQKLNMKEFQLSQVRSF